MPQGIPVSKSNVWMPLYVGDYLADTMHLNAEEHGAYLLLLMHYWRTGPLPDTARALAGIARVSADSWAGDLGDTVRAFFRAEGGRLHHGRVDAELLKARSLSSKRRAAGKRGAASKHGRPMPEETPDAGAGRGKLDGNGVANATGLPEPGHRQSPSPSPSPSQEERKRVGLTASPDASAPGTSPAAPIQPELITAKVHSIGHDPAEAVRLWNAMAMDHELPQVQRLNDTRRRKVMARLRESGGIEGWKVALEKVGTSSFLCGDNDKGWTADFDFLLQASSFTKLMEGGYDRRRRPEPPRATPTPDEERAALRAHLVAQGASYG